MQHLGIFLLLLPVLIFCPSLSVRLDGPVVASLSQGRYYLAATSVGNLALFAGGYNSTTYCSGAPTCNSSTSNVVDIYDSSSGSWTKATLSQDRYLLAATSVGNLALFAGGAKNINSTLLDRVDIFNASSGVWTTATLSQPRAQLAATSVGNLAFFAGGLMNASTTSAVVDIYNASSGTWSTASLSQPRADMAAVSVGSLAMFAGGDDARGPSGVVDIYNATSGKWTTATLSEARFFLAATSVGDLALFGGGMAASGLMSVVDIYNASSNTWTNASLSQARYTFSASSVGNLAFFAGGHSNSEPSAVVDIYNATSNTWTNATLTQPRYALTATSVADHVILFAGGAGPSGGITYNTVDMFTLTTSVPSPTSSAWPSTIPSHSSSPSATPSTSPSPSSSPSVSPSPSSVPVPSAVVMPEYDPTIPEVEISSPSSGTTLRIGVGITSLEEISPLDNTSTQHIDLRQVLWTVQQYNGSQGAPDCVYTAHLGDATGGANNATLQLWFNTFDSDLLLTTETNYTFTVTPALLKFTLNISNWAWESPDNKLRLTIKVTPQVISVTRWNETPQAGMTTLLLSGKKGHGVLARILNFGETWSVGDDEAERVALRVPVEASVSINSSSLSITFDHFNDSILFDPDFGMMLGSDAGKGGGGSDDAVVIGVAVAVPLAVLFVVVVIAVMLAVFAIQKRRRRKAFRRAIDFANAV